MSQEVILGRITQFNEDGTVVIQATVPNIERAILRKYDDVEVGFTDGRHISAIQRRKVYSILNEIAAYIGDDAENTKETMKFEFLMNRFQGIQRRMFSLSNVSMNTASEFIDYLIEFCVKNDIPMSISPLEYCEDIAKYIYACLANRKCCICGKEAHIHHCEGSRIGAGNDREKVHHLGREVLPLCGVHHDECHRDEAGFIEKYHLQKIKLDEALCKKLKLKK